MKINLKLFVNIYIKKDISNIYDMLSYLLLYNYVYTYILHVHRGHICACINNL